jgi:hypothetical protein
MDTKKTGGPAFPTTDQNEIHSGEVGMTLRDYFAAKILEGDTANSHETGGAWPNDSSAESLENRARLYYRMADAMLKVREE